MTASLGDSEQTRLAAAEALEVVRVDDGVVLATAQITLRLEGGVASFVHDQLLPALAGTPTRRELWARWPNLPRDDAERVLERLVDSGIVTELEPPGAAQPPAWTTLVSTDRSVRRQLAERLTSLRVTVVGADAGAGAVLHGLQDAGVGRLTQALPEGTEAPLAGSSETRSYAVTQAGVAALLQDQDLVLVMTEPSLAAVRIWSNQAGLAAQLPVLHGILDGPAADVGPLVLPGEGPCYLCWRMRALACEDDFDVAMAREEARDGSRRGAAASRPTLPGLPESVAAVLIREVLALTAGIGALRMAHHVIRVDALNGTTTRHRVLPRPDCPACAKKDRPPRAAPSLAELLAEPVRRTPFDAIAAAAVSPVSGIVRRLDRVAKDIEEPELPVVVRAELANSRFATGDDRFVGCSGKGEDVESARDTALGEALERYSSIMWDPPRRYRGTAADLPGRHLDPRELVLFADRQYEKLPFAPYHPETVLDWVPARSLVTDHEVWVPLLASHLGYGVPDHLEQLFPATSNGFAAGPTLGTAVESALLEVVERDAFLMTWFHRLGTSRLDARSVPDEATRSIASAYARRAVDIEVHVLPTDTAATVCLAVAWSDQAPAAVVGLGAARDRVDAARKAVLELAQVRPALRARLRDPATQHRMRRLVIDPSSVTELEDHDLLYADPEAARDGLAHWRQGDVLAWDAARDRTPPSPEDLVVSVAEAAGDVLYLDVTTPDVDDLGVKVARVIAPGFQPIHFGADRARLGHPRLLRVPVDLGLRERTAAIDELNLAPHPLA